MGGKKRECSGWLTIVINDIFKTPGRREFGTISRKWFLHTLINLGSIQLNIKKELEWADKTSLLRAELVKAREAINKYKSECETTAPDSLYKRTCREKMFEAIASIDRVLGEAE